MIFKCIINMMAFIIIISIIVIKHNEMIKKKNV